ncbi:TcpE family conjugal transfer membrane protein [Streptosporangium saharense]|uniref:MinD-like ATPase involved in chromosome partitioning or flagellar assembly n=1 Tax=Streptosporangium saharense TaxID=1706840 RepID=A0A7W7QQQ0_9ACTN|nr:TcpE family conjugal transfer membrane protein [Streptosporangium saharense]MBB4917960.1 MinD-like ATPase involved in chromosome partitioning or flagellar assembly [Streptosporangium saharense]
MDLPTYTNIWRIEKRLYKLYDLRLPTPLPIVWIGVFVGVAAPWSLLLALLGLPFDAPWHVVYLVPPGVVTWLSTRPVIESKRLTELLQSQVRYMGEPRSWCRMAPTAEPSEIALTGRVWRADPRPVRVKGKAARKAKRAAAPAVAPAASPSPVREVRPVVAAAAAQVPVRERPVKGTPPVPRRGTAPALGSEAPSPVERVFAPSARALPEQTPVREFPERVPVRETEVVRVQRSLPASETAPEAARARASAAPQSTVSQGVVSPVVASPVSRAQAPAAPVPTAPEPKAAEPVAPTAVESTPASTTQDAPIGPEALRRLRRLAAVTEAERAAAFHAEPPPVVERSTPVARPDEPERQAVLPELPQRATPAPATEAPAEAPAPEAVAPKAPAAEPEAPARQVPVNVPPATASPRDAAPVDIPAGADEGVRAQHRRGQPVPAEQFAERRRLAEEQRIAQARAEEQRAVQARAEEQREAEERRARQARRGQDRLVARAPKAEQIPQVRRSQEQQVPGDQRRPAQRQGPPQGVSIRAVPSEPTAGPAPVVPPVPVPRPGQTEAKVRRVESVVGRDSAGGWRRLAQVVIGPGAGRTDGSEIDEARAKAMFTGSRRVVVLGCTGGAGQTTTALMLGHTLARHREDRVLAVDANTGANALSGRIQAESPETLTSLLAGLDSVNGYLGMRAYTSRCASGLEVLAGDADSGAEQRLSDRTLFSDRRLGRTMDLLDRHYKLVVVDPAAALAARVLPYADQLVLVVPASEDGPDAVAMTYEWLDGHGCADLRKRAIMVVNGVSRRSMGDVEQAEAVARGRCRAIVRVPWEDELAPGRSERVEPSHLRAPGRRAYLALAGVVVAGFGTAQAVRPSEEEVAQ